MEHHPNSSKREATAMIATALHLVPSIRSATPGFGISFPREVPMFAHVATPVDQVDKYNGVDRTETGVVCGLCSEQDEHIVRHASSAHVAECHAIHWDFRAQTEWEMRVGA